MIYNVFSGTLNPTHFTSLRPHYCTDPDVTLGSDRGCPLVVHYWEDLQSVHGFRCYGNTMEMRGRAQR